ERQLANASAGERVPQFWRGLQPGGDDRERKWGCAAARRSAGHRAEAAAAYSVATCKRAGCARLSALSTAANRTWSLSLSRRRRSLSSAGLALALALPDTLPAMDCPGMRCSTYSTCAVYSPLASASSLRRLPVIITKGNLRRLATVITSSVSPTTLTLRMLCSVLREACSSTTTA